jgi:NitT/TauT family transport system substrate-binding protein
MLKKLLALVAAGVILVVAGCRPAAQPPQNASLKIASLPRTFDMIAYAAQQEGLFASHQLAVEIVLFRSVVEMDNALLAGDIDGCIQGTYEAVNLNKEQETSKLVAHNLMPDMFEIIVSPSSGIASPSQLKGKDIATSTGTINEYALDMMLSSVGLNSKDVNYVNVPNMPLRLEMMAQGKLPAAIFTQPLSDQAISDGGKLLMDDSKQPLGGPGLIFSNAALKNKSEGIGRFVQSWQESVRVINASPEKYRSLLVTTAKVPDALAATVKIPVFPELRLPTRDELSVIVTWMKAKKMITQDFPYEKAVETKYLK